MTEVARPGSSVGFLLAQLGTFTARNFREVLAPLGLEPPHFAVLRFVAVAEGQSQNALSDALQVLPSRMVALVDELEERRLLERRADPNDRRVRALHLTPKGRRVLEQGLALAMEFEGRVCAPLDQKERAQLVRLLRRIVEAHGLVEGVHPELGSSPP